MVHTDMQLRTLGGTTDGFQSIEMQLFILERAKSMFRIDWTVVEKDA
jgi:hypothetical protein